MKKLNLELVLKVLVFTFLTFAAASIIFDAIVNGSNIL
jgi:hypothetical protein